MGSNCCSQKQEHNLKLEDRIKTPKLTVDCIVEYEAKIVLVKRKHPPLGWALPGGFVEIGETVEQAVRRELMEETNMELKDLKQFHVYSDPKRDLRFHTVSVVFTARSDMEPKAGDDADDTKLFTQDEISKMNADCQICFDHGTILADYFSNTL